jgi:hypothetical protein
VTGTVRRWPLFLIAAPAAVAVWSGWVGLGDLCGFGIVHPLPGIASSFRLDTAITLPVGVEAYAAYALGAWLAPVSISARARTFARGSAIGSLCLGMLGQAIFHLLAAEHAHRAPWPVVLLVACLPVVTLGFGAALTHLLRAAEPHSVTAPETAPEPSPAPQSSAPARRTRAQPRPAPDTRTRSAAVTETDAEIHYAPDLAAGSIPSQRRIRADLHVGQDRARALRSHLETVSTS